MPNQGGYSKKDVHGQINVKIKIVSNTDFEKMYIQGSSGGISTIQNSENAATNSPFDMLSELTNTWKIKQVRFKLKENQINVFEHMEI